MGGNMAAFDNPVRGADSDIQLHVEGKTDEEVIGKRWLERHSDLRRSFSEILSCNQSQSVTARLEQGPSGCEALVQRLRVSLGQSDVIAMGLADRDILFAKDTLDLFLEPDDVKFRQGVKDHYQDLEGRLWVLPRWEIENYLLQDLDLLLNIWKDNGLSNAVDPPNSDTAIAMGEALLRLADEAAPLVSAALASTRKGQPHKTVPGMDKARGREAMEARVRSTYIHLLDEDLAAEQHHLERFAPDPHAPLPEHWERVSRLVDGKWIIGRMSLRWLRLNRSQIRLNLASNLALKQKAPPDEIVDLLTAMRAKANEIGRQKRGSTP